MIEYGAAEHLTRTGLTIVYTGDGRPPRGFAMLDEHVHTLLEATQRDGLHLGSDPVADRGR